MKHEGKYDDLIEKLKQLPKVKDSREKEEVYKNIQLEMSRSSRRTAKRSSLLGRRMIPVFSAVLVLAIIVILLPSLFNKPLQHTSNNSNRSVTQSPSISIAEEEIVNENNSVYTTENSNESQDEKAPNNQKSLLFDHDQKYTLNHSVKDHTIVYGAVTEEQLQYFIPITFLVEAEEDLSHAYNQLNRYIEEDQWGVTNSILHDITYDVDQHNREVIVHFPEGFTFANGSARLNAFHEMLTMMFHPYQIEKIVFRAKNDEMIDMGHFGDIEEIPLLDPVPSHYKLYKYPESSRGFLIPIKMYEKSIQEALKEMKKDDEFYHVYATIPREIQFQVDIIGEELILAFTQENNLKDEQKYITMIEAILMTAKSYELKQVLFKNSSIDQIGSFDLSKPIQVPEMINPIFIRN